MKDINIKIVRFSLIFADIFLVGMKTWETKSLKREFFHRVIWCSTGRPRISFKATVGDVRRWLASSMETQATSTKRWRCNENLNEKWEWKTKSLADRKLLPFDIISHYERACLTLRAFCCLKVRFFNGENKFLLILLIIEFNLQNLTFSCTFYETKSYKIIFFQFL